MRGSKSSFRAFLMFQYQNIIGIAGLNRRGIKNNANSLSVFEQNAGVLSSMIYKQRFF